jgi:hypothetical protein
MPGFIDAVDVAERGREQVSATDRIEAGRHFQRVLGRRVELRGLVTDDIVLLAAHCAGLDFEHQVILRERAVDRAALEKVASAEDGIRISCNLYHII